MFSFLFLNSLYSVALSLKKLKDGIKKPCLAQPVLAAPCHARPRLALPCRLFHEYVAVLVIRWWCPSVSTERRFGSSLVTLSPTIVFLHNWFLSG